MRLSQQKALLPGFLARHLPYVTTLAVLLGTVGVTPGLATWVRPMSPRTMAHHADRVFAGTVTALRSERHQGTIVTRVTFHNLRIAKGQQGADSVVLTLEGGQVGEETVVVDGQPSFRVGERYIVFAMDEPPIGSPARRFVPVVGMTQGHFRIRPDGNQVGRVHDAYGRPLTRLSADRLSVVMPDSLIPARYRSRFPSVPSDGVPSQPDRSTPYEVLLQREDPGTRVTEEEFLGQVLTFMRR